MPKSADTLGENIETSSTLAVGIQLFRRPLDQPQAENVTVEKEVIESQDLEISQLRRTPVFPYIETDIEIPDEVEEGAAKTEIESIPYKVEDRLKETQEKKEQEESRVIYYLDRIKRADDKLKTFGDQIEYLLDEEQKVNITDISEALDLLDRLRASYNERKSASLSSDFELAQHSKDITLLAKAINKSLEKDEADINLEKRRIQQRQADLNSQILVQNAQTFSSRISSLFTNPSALFQRKKLEKEIKINQQELENVTSSSESLASQKSKISLESDLADRELKQNTRELVLKETEVIRHEYDILIKEILDDPLIKKDLSDSFLKNLVKPVLEKAGLSTTERTSFFISINKYLKIQDKSSPESQEMLSDITNSKSYLEIPEITNLLINGKPDKILKGILSKKGNDEIEKLIGRLNLTRDHNNPNKVFIFNKLKSMHSPTTDEGLLFSKFNIAEYAPAGWYAFKESSILSNIFSKEITNIDNESALQSIEYALNTPYLNSITNLRYYPNPDTLEALLLLSASQSENDYINEILRNTILSLSSRPDWALLVKSTLEKTPNSNKLREILLSWGEFDLSEERQADFVKSFSSTAINILLDSDKSSLSMIKKDRAMKSLANESIVDLAKEAKVIPTELIEKINIAIQQIHSDKNPGFYKILKEKFNLEFRSDLVRYFKDPTDSRLEETLNRLGYLGDIASIITKNADLEDNSHLKYLISDEILDIRIDNKLTQQLKSLLLNAYKVIPALKESTKDTTGFDLRANFVKAVIQGNEDTINEQNLPLIGELVQGYTRQEDFVRIFELVLKKELPLKRAIEMQSELVGIIGTDQLEIATKSPRLFLRSPEDIVFFREILEAYPVRAPDYNQHDILEISRALSSNSITRELALDFPKLAQVLNSKHQLNTKHLIIGSAETLIKDRTDIIFYNQIAAQYGNQAHELIQEYLESIQAGVITTESKAMVLEFLKRFRSLSPPILTGYLLAKENSTEEMYIAELNAITEKLTGKGKISDTERNKPYFNDLLKHVYQNNAGNWSSYESNANCQDRSNDLRQFKIRPLYKLNLASVGNIDVREGETLNLQILEDLKADILNIGEKAQKNNFDVEMMKKDLISRVDELLPTIIQSNPTINLENVRSIEDKLFLVLTDTLYGSKSLDITQMKRFILEYEFSTLEDVRNYILGTSDRISRAPNQDYALLCELHTFYIDRMKEAVKTITEAGSKSEELKRLMPEYFARLQKDRSKKNREETLRKIQVDKLGLTAGFTNQIRNTFIQAEVGRKEKKNGSKLSQQEKSQIKSELSAKYTDDRISKIIERYERITKGLQEDKTTSKKARTKAFYSTLKSQRGKTIEAAKLISGQELLLSEFAIGRMNLSELIETDINIEQGKYIEDQFFAYTGNQLTGSFSNEVGKIEGELNKFVSEGGSLFETLNGYITKNKESANARMVGGVCVSGDNPHNNGTNNLWDMENYFQLVFQEPGTLRCQGVVLLHHYVENGVKVLTASLNPSSTYMFSVDEEGLFNSIVENLELFAQDNDFDRILISTNPQIRTNRTGGAFEAAIKSRVEQIGEKFEFDNQKVFSYKPQYYMKGMDVIWRNPNK